MKKRVTQRLIRTNATAAVLCILFTLYLAINVPNIPTMWGDRAWAAEQIQRAQTAEQMGELLQLGVSSVETSQTTHMIHWRMVLIELLLIFAFLVSNAVRLWKLQQEICRDDHAT